MTSSSKTLLNYVLTDFVAAIVGWLSFTALRFHLMSDMKEMADVHSLQEFLMFPDVWIGQVCFPIFFVFIFYLSGYYNNLSIKSRLQELLTTMVSTLIGCIVIFFAIIVNDKIPDRSGNYELVCAMWLIMTISVYLPRFLIINTTARRIHRGEIKINTLVVGDDTDAVIRSIKRSQSSTGYVVVATTPFAGDEVAALCKRHNIQTIVIAPGNHSNEETLRLVNNLFRLNLPIKLSPEIYDIITSGVKHANITSEPFVNIAQSSMPEWQKSVKRTVDIVVSTISLILLLPAFAVISFLIKRDSQGSVFYKQERIGRHGKPFNIYKFRTMYSDAESDGVPRLTGDNDRRITRIGSFLRKYRIDETPQFWNVIKGDMSLVGPRPEREYFAQRIVEKAPYYTLTYRIRPGITSWGMVKYGYAQTVDEMIERSKYDLIYLENMSLFIDIKIVLYTVRTVLTGKGI